jgi:acetolactate synthase I/II/III large subunit
MPAPEQSLPERSSPALREVIAPLHRTPALRHAPAESPRPAEAVSGAELLIRALEAEGVEIIFGHPGGAVIKVYDEMARLQPSFRHILVRHEQGGTHAAEGYAKATGKVGTVIVTSGPGATNTVTGIADAYMDSVPIVVLTGQVPRPMIGNDAFQEVDMIGVTRSITKHSFLVREAEDIPSIIRQAYHIARSGRPGPVVVDLPKDVLAAQARFGYDAIPLRGFAIRPEIDQHQVEKAAEMMGAARRPVLYVGGGAINSGASEVVAALAHKTGIPVTTTLHGLGAFPEDDPLSLGMLGMHGTWYANQAVQHTDLLIAVGARFDDRVTGKVDEWAPHAKVIHIDIDPSCIGKNVFVDCPIVGDVRQVLDRLIILAEKSSFPDWIAMIDHWKAECPLEYDSSDGLLRPQFVLRHLGEKTGGDAVVVSDVGQNQMWTAQYFRYRYPRSHITSGGLGTMGFSLPAAMGAAFGVKDRPVISISGDGGFVMNAQELSVAAAHRLPLKVVILNNGFLGMVRQWQELFHENRFSHTNLEDTNPDFVKLAEAHHCVGMRATTPEEACAVIEKAWEINDRPVVMEFRVTREEMVFPMVPAGGSNGQMITARTINRGHDE